MEHAWTRYRADEVSWKDLVEDGDSFVVELGSGQCEPPDDPEVYALALRMYATLDALPPQQIFLYVTSSDFSADVYGVTWASSCSTLAARKRARLDDDEWSVDLMRRLCKMWHIAPNVLQHYESPAAARSLGHTKVAFSFPCDRKARLAVAIDRFHRVSPWLVLEYLCSVSRPRRRTQTWSLGARAARRRA